VTAIPLLPRNAPFSPEDIEVLNSVVARTTPQQRSWLAGFFAGFEAAQAHGAPQPQPAPAAKPRVPLTVLYASESGNAEALAMRTKKLAQKHGLDARVFDMADVDLGALAKAKNLMVFASTWGEGDPPGRAADFYNALMGEGAPRLDKSLRFAVLSLGDTAYAQFCATGKAIDARLEALGATRAADRIDLDLDFAKKAAEWTEGALGKLAPADTGPSARVVHVDFKGAAQAPEEETEPLYTPESPLAAEIATLINLNGTGSTRETWHLELTTEAPGFAYLPGDSVGILPENDPDLALALAEAVGLGANGSVVEKLR
jgi:sulfite reductase (NADPH) flavoprotein alpha-component